MAALDEVKNTFVSWHIARDNTQKSVNAIPSANQSITTLANMIGLDASAWRSWLYHDPNTNVKIIGNNSIEVEISLNDLTETHILSSNNIFKVPNTIVAVYAGNLGEAGQELMQWNKEIEYLKSSGFHVNEVKKVGNTSLTSSFKTQMNTISTAKELQGIYIGWCHGSNNTER
jgi:hypothetical protein